MSQPGDGFDMELMTAALLADSGDVAGMMSGLVEQLARTMGDRVRVERRGGLMRRGGGIRGAVVTLGSDSFGVEMAGGAVVCRVGHTSGGIRIRSEQLGVEEWLRRLLGRLQEEAVHNQLARDALQRIATGGDL